MEIPIIWRETATRTHFVGEMKTDEKTGSVYFKYPGGEVPALGVVDLVSRLERKGFDEESIGEIVELFWKTVASEAPVSMAKVLDRVG